MSKQPLIVLLLIALSGCTFTDDAGKRKTLDLDFNHHIQFQRMPSQRTDSVAPALDSSDACSNSIPVDTLVLLHGDELGSEVNARPAPSLDQWYDPPIMSKVGDSVRVLSREGEWYQARWVTPNDNVLISYFHCSVLKEPN